MIEKAFREAREYADNERGRTGIRISCASSLGRYIASPLGQAELEKVQPHTDRARLDEDLAEAEEATEYLRAAARPQPAARGAAIRINFSSIPDLTASGAQAAHRRRGARAEGNLRCARRSSTARPMRVPS